MTHLNAIRKIFLVLALLMVGVSAMGQEVKNKKGAENGVEADKGNILTLDRGGCCNDMYFQILDKSNLTVLVYWIGRTSWGVSVPTIATIPARVNWRGKIFTVSEIDNHVVPKVKGEEVDRKLYQVIIPNTVTTIRDEAFRNCAELKDVVLPSSITYIGPKAFEGCPKLLNNARFMEQLAAIVAKNNSIIGIAEIFGETYNQANPANAAQPLVAAAMQPQTPVATTPVATTAAPTQLTTPATAQPKEPTSDIDLNIPQTTKSNENTFAFIIANENYSRVSKVDYALNDGKAMAKYCQRALGVPEDNINTYFDATLNDLNTAVRMMEQIGAVYKGDATFILYYAGHGVPDEANSTSFLLPVDGDGSNAETGLSLKKLYERIAAIPAKSTVVLMDACFSGAQRGDGMLVAARGVAIKAKAEAPKGKMVVLSAAQGDETAYPYREKEHGMFTYYLLKKLQETQGAASLGDLSDYVTEQVSRRSIVKNKKSQTPATQASPALGATWKTWTLQ